MGEGTCNLSEISERVGMYLVGGVAGHGTVGALGGAGGLVDVGVEGGSVAVVRHDGGW